MGGNLREDCKLLWKLQHDLGKGRDRAFTFRINSSVNCDRLAGALARVLGAVDRPPQDQESGR